LDDLAFRLLARHFEIAVEPVFRRNARKKVVDGGRADLGQHLPALLVGFGEITHRKLLAPSF